MSRHRNQDCSGSFLDRLFFRFEKDRSLLLVFTILATTLALVSFAASVVVWLAVYTLPPDHVLQGLCGRICTAGYIFTPVCLVLTVFLALRQHAPFQLGRGVILNLLILWAAFFVFLLVNGSVFEAVQLNNSVGMLLSVIIMLFGGYLLAFVPAVIISCVTAIIHKVFDLILPE